MYIPQEQILAIEQIQRQRLKCRRNGGEYMREYKFRGKRTVLEQSDWIYGYGAIDNDILTLDFAKGIVRVECDKGTIGQYTGLKDCKRTAEYPDGQEICGGDILRITGRYFRRTIQADMEVEYDESRAWFGVVDALHTVSLNEFDCESDVEVIGNRFDNPELREATP